MTPAEAKAIVERHAASKYVTQDGGQPVCQEDLVLFGTCDAHRAATAYLASVAVVEDVDDAKVAAGLTPDNPLWMLLDRMRRQGYGYALTAIDEVALYGEAYNEAWADGFRQGHRAAREAVERLHARAALAEAAAKETP